MSKLLFTVQETLMVRFCGCSHSPTWKGVGWLRAPSVALLTHDLSSLTGMLPTFSVPLIFYNPDMTYAGWSQHSPTSLGSFSSRCQKKIKTISLVSLPQIRFLRQNLDQFGSDRSPWSAQLWWVRITDLAIVRSFYNLQNYQIFLCETILDFQEQLKHSFLHVPAVSGTYSIRTPIPHMSLSIYMSVSHPGYILGLKGED